MSNSAKLASDYSPDTAMRIIRTDDGDVVIRVFGTGEMRIAMSGGRLHGKHLVEVMSAFQTLIDAINRTTEGE